MKSFLIGSLPFDNIEKALDYSFSFTVPTLCSLPKLDQDEFMVDQALRETDGHEYKNHRLVKSEKNYQSCLRFQAEDQFFKRLNNGDYKWQACGPMTLASSLDHHPEERAILESYIEKLIRTQEAFNKRSEGTCYFFIDEPSLAFAGDAAFLYKFIERLRSEAAFKNVQFGLHACSKASPLLLANLDIDLYALDISLYDEEEVKILQVSLADKLVYTPVGSSGEIYEYERDREAFVSSTCGHALCRLDRMDGIKERIQSFEKSY